ncbi:menaquinone biosynthetic enzyme MqnA/MqnD family protein [Thermosulfuriphilus sp.]
MAKVTIGIVGFLNTAPLLFTFRELAALADWEIIEAPPTTLNQALAAGEIDLGLVSSHEYARKAQNYLLLPDISISATGAVGSVLLFSRVPLEEIGPGPVLLTRHSQTSVALLKMILEDELGLRPRYFVGNWAERDLFRPRPVAYLSIGDEALKLRGSQPWPHVYDLASLWLHFTGLPFVFAVMAVCRQFAQEGPEVCRIAEALYRSRREGLRRLEEIACQCSQRISLSEKECLDYLKGLEYNLEASKIKALEIFYRRLFKRGELKKPVQIEFVPC